MTMQVSVTVEIIAKMCPCCGVHYGMDAALYTRRANDGGDWYCPNGDILHIIEPEVENLRKQLASAQGNLDYYKEYSQRKAAEAEQLSHQVRAQKAAKTRLMRRVTNGVCPCCQRQFANVQRHMASKHPEQVVDAQQAVAPPD